MQDRVVTIRNNAGIHCRPSGVILTAIKNEFPDHTFRLITADGNIGKKEVAYLDQCFGMKYSQDNLKEIYVNCREALGDAFLSDYQRGLRLMRTLNGRLADAYKEMLLLIIDIIIESDDVIAPEEIAEAKKIKELF